MNVFEHAGAESVSLSFISYADCTIVVVSSASALFATIGVAASTTVWDSYFSSTHDNLERINTEKC